MTTDASHGGRRKGAGRKRNSFRLVLLDGDTLGNATSQLGDVATDGKGKITVKTQNGGTVTIRAKGCQVEARFELYGHAFIELKSHVSEEDRYAKMD